MRIHFSKRGIIPWFQRMKNSRRLKNNSKRSMSLYVIKLSYGINQGKHSRSKIESYKSKFKSTKEWHNQLDQDQWLMWRFYSEQQRHFSSDTFCMRPCTYSSLGEMLGLHFALYFAQFMLPYATFSHIKTHFLLSFLINKPKSCTYSYFDALD